MKEIQPENIENSVFFTVEKRDENSTNYVWLHTFVITHVAQSDEDPYRGMAGMVKNFDRLMQMGDKAREEILAKMLVPEKAFKVDVDWYKVSAVAIRQLILETSLKVYRGEEPYAKYLSKECVPIDAPYKTAIGFRLNYTFFVRSDDVVVVSPEVSVSGIRDGIPVEIFESSNEYLPTQPWQQL